MSDQSIDLARKLNEAAPRGLRLRGLAWHDGSGDGPRSGDVCLREGRFRSQVDPAARELNLAGWTLLPGFVDSHLHLFHEARQSVHVDLSGLRCREDLWDLLAAAPPDGPLGAVGWDEALWDDPRFPTRAELDHRFPEREIWLMRICGHVAVASGRVLRRFAGHPNLRDADLGLLTEDAAYALSDLYPPDEGKLLASAREVAESLAAEGLTAIVEMGARDLPRRIASLDDDFPLRVGYFRPLFPDETVDAPSKPAGRHRELGRKLFLDGSLGASTAAVADPYLDGERGLLLWDSGQLAERVAAVMSTGGMIAMHAIGERAISQALDAVESVGAPPGRCRIEHLEMAGPAQIERMAKLGVIASLQPNFMDRWGRDGGLYEQRLGSSWRSRFAAPGQLRSGGLAPVYGTDGMPRDLWGALRAAIDTTLFGDEADTPAQALGAVTAAAALAAGEGAVPLLSDGAAADFILAPSDPLQDGFSVPSSLITCLEGKVTSPALTE